MSIFSRMIYRRWLRALVSVSTILFIILAIATTIDSAIRDSVSFTQSYIYLMLELPTWIREVLPLSTLIATLWCLEGLRKENELVVLLSTGYGANKICRRLFELSVFVTVFLFCNNFYFLPLFNNWRGQWLYKTGANFKKYKLQKTDNIKSFKNNNFWIRTPDKFLRYQFFDEASNTISDLSVYDITEDRKIRSIVNAKKAKFIEDQSWELKDAQFLNHLASKEFATYQDFNYKKLFLGISKETLSLYNSDIFALDIENLWSYLKALKKTDNNINSLVLYFLGLLNSTILPIIFVFIPIQILSYPIRRFSTFKRDIFFTLIFYFIFYQGQSLLLNLGNQQKLAPGIAVFTLPILLVFFIFYRLQNVRALV